MLKKIQQAENARWFHLKKCPVFTAPSAQATGTYDRRMQYLRKAALLFVDDFRSRSASYLSGRGPPRPDCGAIRENCSGLTRNPNYDECRRLSGQQGDRRSNLVSLTSWRVQTCMRSGSSRALPAGSGASKPSIGKVMLGDSNMTVD